MQKHLGKLNGKIFIKNFQNMEKSLQQLKQNKSIVYSVLSKSLKNTPVFSQSANFTSQSSLSQRYVLM